MGRRFRVGGSLNNENMLYDDSAFQLFFVSMLAVYWIPSALFRLLRVLRQRWRSKAQVIDGRARLETCPCSLCMRMTDGQKSGQKRKGWTLGIWDVVFLLVTVTLAFGAIKVYTANLKAEQPFDPFEILRVSRNAGKREISKAYRRLSLEYHPDKNPHDPEASDKFVRLAKAHAALTDPTARNNYKKYGNPDGYQGTTLGIALPAWVSEHRVLLMLFYLLAFCVVFPLVVGIWWMKQSKMLTKHVTKESFQNFAECLVKSQKYRDYVIAYGTASEFESLFKEKNVEYVRQLIFKLRKEELFDLKKIKWFRPLETYQVQNLVVLMAYLHRIEIPAELQYVVADMLGRTEPLVTAFVDTMGLIRRPDCSKVYPNHHMRGNLARLSLCLKVSQHVFQAVGERYSLLLQIPHFTQRLAKMCAAPRSSQQPVKTVYSLAKLEPEDQKIIARGLSDEEWLDVKAFCDRYPHATVEMSKPFVEDEEDGVVRASDRITITAILTVSRRAGSVYSPHCPNLPPSAKKSEVWWAILSDKKLNCPIEVKRLLPGHSKFGDPDRIESSVSEEELDPRTTVYEMKFSFMAPQPGTYTYELKVDVDCYIGCEQSRTATVKVLEAVEPAEGQLPKYFDTDDESSCEEEDSSDEQEEDDEDDEDDEDYEDDGEDRCVCGECNEEDEAESTFQIAEESDTEIGL